MGALLHTALEETEAQRGLLILSRGGEHRIAAEATRRRDDIIVRALDVAVSAVWLPASLLEHVLRTRESVVINDSTAWAEFAADLPLGRPTPRSTLCLPLLHQGKVVGVLYLENHLASGVFTPARVKVLKLVASLAASALENSRVCRDLREREARVRRLIDANIMGMYVVDIRGPILDSNDAYLRMLGYERRDLVSGQLRWTDLTPPEWRAADKERVERVKRSGRLLPFEKEFFRKNGTRVPVLMGVARLKEPRTQAVVFALDMSKQKQAEALALDMRAMEQTRAARKLHEALLQNFQGAMFRLQAARNLLTRDPDEGLRSLNDAIIDGEMALDDSRDAIDVLGKGSVANGHRRTAHGPRLG